jgi:membrane-associated phospholipid phosphatase
MNYLTDFADQAVVLPLAAALLLVLLALGWRRGAAAWAGGVGGVLAVMLALKLLTMACQRHLGFTGLSSPSGHTAASAVVYGGLLALLAPRTAAGTLIAATAGGAVAVVFGLSRLALHVHTVPDVILGAIVGVGGAIMMRWAAGPRPARLATPWLLLAAVAMMFAFHGHRMEAEDRIRWLALEFWPLDRCK